MSEKGKSEIKKYSTKRAIGFGFAQVADVTSIQTFTFLVFTFYFAIAEINVNLITLGFVIWSIWNAFNDPMIGYLSDRTHTKLGRRIPYIMISLVPLSVIMFFLFTPPIFLNNEMANFTYFLIIIIIWEGIYTMFAVTQTSLFPEVFLDKIERTKANNVRQIFSIVGLIMAFILPTLFIPDLTNKENLINFQIIGLISGLIIFISGILFLKLGAKEREEFKEDYKEAPNFFLNLKYCVNNKSFRWVLVTEIVTWFIFGMLPTIAPLYGKHVLQIGPDDSILLGLLLGMVFIAAAIFMNLWKFIAQKIGIRKSYMISMPVFIITLLPFLFISSIPEAFIAFFFIGLGLSGNIYFSDLLLCDVIDADEVETKIRREAGYYGVNALFMRFSTVFVFLCINLVFNNIGWYIYDPEVTTPEIIFGLKTLICIFPIIALGISIFAISRYPLDGENLVKMKEQLQNLHDKKKSKL